jgi:alkanesulfonate monooxygenase SsuD/methylene tetrahydromethanopterin reductase-like flavin-dependent oxidoreductase (luciferase family)
MKFFLSGLSNFYDGLELVKTGVIEADKLGFDGALMADHYMWDSMGHMQFPKPNSTLDTWVTFTYLAAKTERIRLGTLVTPIPLRSPSILAKMLSTLDVLSGGRVVLGVGAGWSKSEFDAYSNWGSPKVRVDRTIEGLKLMRKLWTEDEVNFEGKFYVAKGAVLDPKPVQKPYPQLLFGSTGNRMIRLASKYANICYVGSMLKMMHPNIKSKTIKGGCSYYMVPFPNTSLVESMTHFANDIMPSYQ